jgi:hypothetical protein
LTANCSPAADAWVWTGGSCVGGNTAATCTVSPRNTTTYGVTGLAFGQAGAAANVTANVTNADQSIGSISFSLPTLPVGGTTTASATATSGLAVAFSSKTPNICTVSGTNGGTVTGVATGTCTIAADQAGDANFAPATQVTQTILVGSGTRLFNLSTRAQTLTGGDIVIGGFTISGSAAKTVVLRARGPSMSGITSPLANPMLQLFSGPTQIASNDNWQSDPAQAALITSSGFAPSNPNEAAIYKTLSPGAYTAFVTGVGGTGVGIFEVFEVDKPEAPLINISTRANVKAGENVMIGGFIIQGSSPQTVVVRARGPSLAGAGIANFLADPVLTLYSGASPIAVNDNWTTDANQGLLLSSGFAPNYFFEAAVYRTLAPGAYTVVVSGVTHVANDGSGLISDGTGVAIVEVFAVP